MSEGSQPEGQAAALRRLLGAVRYEVVPLGGVERDLPALPAGATVTVTCSPRRGLDPTLALAERLAAGGFRAVPHLAARMVRDRAHLAAILRRLDAAGIREAFVVGGDAREPLGPFDSGHALLTEMADLGHGLEAVGIPGYPEPHPLIGEDALLRALLDKQPHATYMVTQMCFDPEAVVAWLARVRRSGVRLPLYVGVPGAIRRARLVQVAVRVGVGESLRYLDRHGSLAGPLLARSRFRPDGFLARLSALVAGMDGDVVGLHLNTFNQLGPTERWRWRALRTLRVPGPGAPRPEDDPPGRAGPSPLAEGPTRG